ncbi:hypothetical protein JSQ81_09340 [Sporosarcina sp. Marseille-Q4063]|uniref:hypothetical protein n=1 Tax=Sporosarcina sp. Marseille-Q4063 TaxID=2810514 RepID=UPI001BAFF892|nr:hypothetical protein [Sporosarcina sp. Marseille-Q4063]QUW23678.1 hypothetical protein JSQ81_09340 [Sporosarcina sp. Marseille-Q4063]
MIEKFRLAEPLFQGQIHECQQFILTFNGAEFKGVYKDDEINWYYPQPTIETDDRVELEIEVFSLMSHLIQ